MVLCIWQFVRPLVPPLSVKYATAATSLRSGANPDVYVLRRYFRRCAACIRSRPGGGSDCSCRSAAASVAAASSPRLSRRRCLHRRVTHRRYTKPASEGPAVTGARRARAIALQWSCVCRTARLYSRLVKPLMHPCVRSPSVVVAVVVGGQPGQGRSIGPADILSTSRRLPGTRGRMQANVDRMASNADGRK